MRSHFAGMNMGAARLTPDGPERQCADPDLRAKNPLRTFWPTGSPVARVWNARCRQAHAPPRPLGHRLGPQTPRVCRALSGWP